MAGFSIAIINSEIGVATQGDIIPPITSNFRLLEDGIDRRLTEDGDYRILE